MVPKTDISVSDFKIKNEPVLGYLPGSKERSDLEAALNKYSDVTEDVPIVIGGKEYRTDQVHYQPMVHNFSNHSVKIQEFYYYKKFLFFQPHNHGKKVAKFYYATPELVNKAIDTSLQAKKEWEKIPLDDRLQFFLKIADLMAGKYRAELNATTMLGQAKTVIQVVWKFQDFSVTWIFRKINWRFYKL